MNDRTRRIVADAWALRARVEREATRRFTRLARAIRELDPGSPVPAMMERAAGEEIRHAALCAQLCETYGRPPADDGADETIAPAQLAPREAVLYEVVAACCITETESVATLTTLLAASACPPVRDVLHEIARDEVRHSRMGWAHLAREEPRGVAFLTAWIPVMLAGTVAPGLFDPAAAELEAEELLVHGVLPHTRKRALFVAALTEVVFPGLERFGVNAAPARSWLAAQRA